MTKQSKSEPERCGYCHINLDKYPDHDVHWCKKNDDQCRCCGKDISEIDSYQFDPHWGAFCSVECKELQFNK
jgi:hypothetical protein